MSQFRTWSTRLTTTNAPASTVLIRLFVGVVFLSEGIQKFVYPDALGTGRFEKVGIPAAGFVAPLDGVFETACGVLILFGLLTRAAAVPMIVDMIGALLITKLPLLWGDAALFPGKSGWWALLHESRTDLAQLCGSAFLLIVGAGTWSVDAEFVRATSETPNPLGAKIR
ncbi:DoxX family protein [Nocardia sp. CA-084685]|uniref:DoxX family protein n=1 Tax=Nocardia sp. CA-084685 TaxID=3239970 RepID=UPI003D961703